MGKRVIFLSSVALSLILVFPGIAFASHKRVRAYNWAKKRAGDSYCWGGTGPSCFDCSGLVMKAYRFSKIRLPRSTSSMLSSSKIYRIRPSSAREGDLAFYGTGHVELYSSSRKTLGAENQGVHIYRWGYGYGWNPTAFYRVRGGNTSFGN